MCVFQVPIGVRGLEGRTHESKLETYLAVSTLHDKKIMLTFCRTGNIFGRVPLRK